MITKEHLIEIMNAADNSPEKVELQEHFANICLYSTLANEILAPDFPKANEHHTIEQEAIMRKGIESIKTARKSLEAIDKFCLKVGLEPITDVDLRDPAIFKTYADFISETINAL